MLNKFYFRLVVVSGGNGKRDLDLVDNLWELQNKIWKNFESLKDQESKSLEKEMQKTSNFKEELDKLEVEYKNLKEYIDSIFAKEKTMLDGRE